MTRKPLAHRKAATALGAAALLVGAGLALAPTASAAAAPGRDIAMPFPLGGPAHNVRFGAMTFCHFPNGIDNPPVVQMLSANPVDLSVNTSNPFDLVAQFLPFNSATVAWTNHTTGKSGQNTVQTNGREVGVRDIPTGTGDLTVTVTASRSAFPTINPGSTAPVASVTHSETFEVPGVVGTCSG
ncbi:hypothetical protein G4X40_20940 [Rhodococcus sp. D2-41]|uniref:hypothetical protein n=1 Tax=Speluncibacter jeojiensis TaxID=2710754 RepID=UPI00240EBF52|nr:hypothetical protein [Rhodococcus sp. D2-41]MDG3012611.1 hypothetical protein [Rhodococcus sp. D2-41]